jgi:16S rRNA (guanine1207-N2)-methyltransferase
MNQRSEIPSRDEDSFLVTLVAEKLEVFTGLGLPDWEIIYPAEQLLASSININPDDRVLLFGCHQGALAAYIGQILKPGRLTVTDESYSALAVTRRTLAKNNISLDNVNFLSEINLPFDSDRTYDAAIIQIPKGRLLARRWIVQAYHALKPGASLYVSGANSSGIQSIIRDAQDIFGAGNILGYRKGNRVAQFIKALEMSLAPPWSQEAGIARDTWIDFSISISDKSFYIRSLPGVFSYNHLDDGTKMLLGEIKNISGFTVLDVGCGYGIIGLFAAALGAVRVDMTEDNIFAVAACRETITLNSFNHITVYPGSLLEPITPRKYDLILSNPPFHTGHKVNYQVAHALITQSYQALEPNGRLIIVANRFIRYERHIKEIFGNVLILDESSRFHVLSALK